MSRLLFPIDELPEIADITGGSELFIVYNEGRDTRASGLPDLQNRSIVVKVNRLLRF